MKPENAAARQQPTLEMVRAEMPRSGHKQRQLERWLSVFCLMMAPILLQQSGPEMAMCAFNLSLFYVIKNFGTSALADLVRGWEPEPGLAEVETLLECLELPVVATCAQQKLMRLVPQMTPECRSAVPTGRWSLLLRRLNGGSKRDRRALLRLAPLIDSSVAYPWVVKVAKTPGYLNEQLRADAKAVLARLSPP